MSKLEGQSAAAQIDFPSIPHSNLTYPYRAIHEDGSELSLRGIDDRRRSLLRQCGYVRWRFIGVNRDHAL